MPEHQPNHPHHHSALQRAGHTAHEDASEVEPYPYIYSKDPMDERRFLHPGEAYGPAYAHGPSTWVLWVLGIVVAVIIGGGLIAAIVQSVTR